MNSSYFSNDHISTSEGLSNLLLQTFSKNIQITNSSDITTNSSNKTIDHFKSAVLKIAELYGINNNKSQANLKEPISKKKFFESRERGFRSNPQAENIKEKLKKINININCDQPSQNYLLNQGLKTIELPAINKINLNQTSSSEKFNKKLQKMATIRKIDLSKRKSLFNLTTTNKINLSLNNKNNFLLKKKLEKSKNIDYNLNNEQSSISMKKDGINFIEKTEKRNSDEILKIEEREKEIGYLSKSPKQNFDEILKIEENEKEMGYLSLMRIPKKKKKNLEFAKGVFDIRIDLKSEKKKQIHKSEDKLKESYLVIENDNLVKDEENKKISKDSLKENKKDISFKKITEENGKIFEKKYEEEQENHQSFSSFNSDSNGLIMKEKKLKFFNDSKLDEFKEEIKSRKSLPASIPSSTLSKIPDNNEFLEIDKSKHSQEESLKVRTYERISEVEELTNNNFLNNENDLNSSKDKSILIEDKISKIKNDSLSKLNIKNQSEKDNQALSPSLQPSKNYILYSQIQTNLDPKKLLVNENSNLNNFNANDDQLLEVNGSIINKSNASENQILSPTYSENNEIQERKNILTKLDFKLIQNEDDLKIKENTFNTGKIKSSNNIKNQEILSLKGNLENQFSNENQILKQKVIQVPPETSENKEKNSANPGENPSAPLQNTDPPTTPILLQALPLENGKTSALADNEFNSNSLDRKYSELKESLNDEIINKKESFLSDDKPNFDFNKNENGSKSQNSIQEEKEKIINRNKQGSFQAEEKEEEYENEIQLKKIPEDKQQEGQKENQTDKAPEEKKTLSQPPSLSQIKILTDSKDRDSPSDLNFSTKFSIFNTARKGSKQLPTPKNFLISPGSRLSKILKKQESLRRGSAFTRKSTNEPDGKKLSIKPNSIISINEDEISSDGMNQSESEEIEEIYDFKIGRSGRAGKIIEILEEEGGLFNNEIELNLEKRNSLLIKSYSLREENIRDSKIMRKFSKFQTRFLKNLESDYNFFRSIYDINSEFNNIQIADRRESKYEYYEWNESPIASELVQLNRLISKNQDGAPVLQCALEKLNSSFKDKEILNSCHSEIEEKNYNFKKCLAYKKREKDIFYIYSDFLKNMSYFNSGSTQNLFRQTIIPEKYLPWYKKRQFCFMVCYDKIFDQNELLDNDIANISILSQEQIKPKKEENSDDSDAVENYSFNDDSDQFENENEEELKFKFMNKFVPMKLKLVLKKKVFSLQSIDNEIIPIISGLNDELKNQLIEQKIMMLDHGSSLQIEKENIEYYQNLHDFRKQNKKAFQAFEIKHKRKNEFNKLLGSFFEDNIPILMEKIHNKQGNSIQEIFNNHRRKPRIIPLLPFDKQLDSESPSFHKKSVYLTDHLNNILHSSASQQNLKITDDDFNFKKKPAKLKRDKAKRNLEISQNNSRGIMMKKSEQGIEGILSLKLPDSYKPPMARPTRRNTKAATIIKIQDEYEKPEKLSQISSETNININFLTNKKKVSDFETKEQNVFVKKFREQNERMDQKSLFLRSQIVALEKLKEYDPSEQMIWAISHHNVGLVEELFISYPGVFVDELDNQGNSFLMLAAQIGSQDIVNLLLSKGANVNLQNNEGNSALHLSLAFLNDEISDKLIAFGANENIKNKEGKTPWEMYVKRQALVV